MDNVTIKLQEFLDGSLPPEEEAELLHRLSVSPERRNLLRSYMKQQAILSTDRAAIAVPYEAEQKLWAALAALPPAAAPLVSEIGAGSAAVATSSVFMKIASVALVSIVIGFATGFFVGNHPSESQRVALVSSTPSASGSTLASINPETASAAITNSSTHSRSSVGYRAPLVRMTQPTRQFPEAPLADQFDMPTAFVVDRPAPPVISADIAQTVPIADALVPGASFVRDPNESRTAVPNLGELTLQPRRAPKFTDRLELSIHEGIGKQFPNTAATNVSIPIVTNTDVMMKFMITPSFWVGAGFGLANVTQKQLQIDAASSIAVSDTISSNLAHQTTAWFGLVGEFRQPISSHFTIAANGGVAASSFGPILSAELGLRYEVSESVGALVGLRGTRATSNVATQFSQLTGPRANSHGLVWDSAVKDDPSMLNLEISTGIYFRF